MRGRLEMHGQHRPITWTHLGKSAVPGDKSIELALEVDWKVGEEIVIAPTGSRKDFEKRIISEVTSLSDERKVIHFLDPLTKKHYSGTIT